MYRIDESNATDLLPDTNCNYVLEIEIDKTTQKPLINNNYRYITYSYISGSSIPFIETKDLENLVVSSYGILEELAVEKLRKENIIVESSDIYKSFALDLGFYYLKEDYPIVVNCYVSEDMIKDGKNVVLFTYYEKRFGKNLSWVKSVPLNL